MYKTEMHCHSASVSICAGATADFIVEKYLEAGYTTIVSTEHINDGTYRRMKELPWQEKVDHFLKGRQALEDAAKGRLHILQGAEIALYADKNDYLVYGITEEFLRSIDDPRHLPSLKELSELVHQNGMLIFQAHPFRTGMTVSKPKYLDGIEIANLSPGTDSNNEFAKMWAEKYSLNGISGTDFHNTDHTSSGGIMTDIPITDNDTLLKTLREKTFTPILK